MKLDRNLNANGKGKYALVRLRPIEKGGEAWKLLGRLDELGVLDWGSVGAPDEFFVLKLCDKYSGFAITAYCDAVMDDSRHERDEARAMDLAQYAIQVQSLSYRAGILNPFCKQPD